MSLARLLLLAATLLLVRLDGSLHGLSHLVEDGHDHDGQPHAACEWCLAYAALDQGLAGAPTATPSGRVTEPVPAAAPRQSCRATPPCYHSRAPPTSIA